MKLIHLILIVCLLCVSSCGFHLRGTAQIPASLQTIALSSNDGNSDILQELRRTLEAGDVNVLDTPQENGIVLVLGTEAISERILSVNSNARAGEFELTMSVPFQLRSGSTLVMGPEDLSIEKVYLADPNNAVAKDEERELMAEEMRSELVNLILRRLQSVEL